MKHLLHIICEKEVKRITTWARWKSVTAFGRKQASGKKFVSNLDDIRSVWKVQGFTDAIERRNTLTVNNIKTIVVMISIIRKLN